MTDNEIKDKLARLVRVLKDVERDIENRRHLTPMELLPRIDDSRFTLELIVGEFESREGEKLLAKVPQ